MPLSRNPQKAAIEVLDAWEDPETWADGWISGKGCSYCLLEPPIVKMHDHPMGLVCLSSWFPDRSDKWVIDWITRQVEQHIRSIEIKSEKDEERRDRIVSAQRRLFAHAGLTEVRS